MDNAPRLRAPAYLTQIPVDEALAMWLVALRQQGLLERMPAEQVATADALGRVLTGPVMARFSSPAYHACAMDGYAVAATTTYGASETNPVQLVPGQSAWPVDTGDPLPAGCDAVIMIEDADILADGGIEIVSGAVPWQHVRPIGEDIAAGEMLLPAGWTLRGTDLAVLTSAGVGVISVRRRPVVAVVPTGDEVTPLAAIAAAGPMPGQVIESNSLLVASIAAEAGGQASVLPVVPDDPQAIEAAIRTAAATADVVVVSAGSSAGSADHTAAIVRRLGGVVVHGVATRPGKPAILGYGAGRPVLGMPGYPVSAWLTLDNFLRPLLAALLGTAPTQRSVIEARLARRMPSPAGVREYLRVKVGLIGVDYVAAPLSRGAGVLSSLVRADGLVVVSEEREGYEAGETVAVQLLRPRAEIDRGLVAIGSHDLSVDVLADLLGERYPGFSLSSANVGSLAGLQALVRREAHLAGTHLLDEATGEYNISYVARMLPRQRVALVCLANRQQGLIVAKGNPLGLAGVADLLRAGVRFINRQRGAGTRVLLDYELRRQGLAADAIEGYRREVYTHLAVAAEVAGGGADAGMGILAAAQALGLDFVPVASERYELAVPADVFGGAAFEQLLALIRSDEFAARVSRLGGYDTGPTGEVRWVEPLVEE